MLRGTGIPEAVDTDLANIQREYTGVVLPFIARYPDLWNSDTHTLELYTKLVAFVMAYRLVSARTTHCTCVRSLISLFFHPAPASKSHRKRMTMKRMKKKRKRSPTHP